MTRDLLSLLAYEAKRDPSLARLIADIPSLTTTEIEQAKVKLPWIRQALLLRKQQQDYDALAARTSEWASHGTTADPVGEMRRWTGPDTFIKIGHSQLEVTAGQLIWLKDGVWIDTIFHKTVDSQVYQYSEPCGTIRLSDYILAVRRRANSLMPHTDEPVQQTIRIYRIT